MKRFWNDTFTPSKFRSKTKVVIGTLNPIMWDKKGKVKKFSIYSFEEEDIIIEGYRNRSKLKSLLNKKVEARGSIRRNEDGEKVIKLTKIKELKNPSTPSQNLTPEINLGMWSEEFSVSIPKDYAVLQYQNLQDSFLEAS
jgi:hypothetical protein